MKRSLVLALLLLFSLFASAQIFYKDLGLLPADKETIFFLHESFPEVESSVLTYLVNSAISNPDKDPDAFPPFVNVSGDAIYISPTLDTPPGFYSLIFTDTTSQNQDLFVLSFQIDQVLKFKINTQSFFLDVFSNSNNTIEGEITTNSNWELYVQSLGDHPDIEVVVDGKSVYPNKTPSLLASGSRSAKTQKLEITVKISANYKDIPANYYVFPLVFTLSTVD